jgi:hypothetical protein
MARLKNVRHERFVKEYIICGSNASEAYRRTCEAYPTVRGPVTNPASYRVVAHEIYHRPEVQKRIEEIQTKMAKKADITIEKVLTDIQEAIAMAKLHARPSEIISGAMAQAKLVGLDRDRVEMGAVGSFDGIENISEILEKVAREEGPEAALALSKAFGLDKAETAEPATEDLIDQTPPTDAVN